MHILVDIGNTNVLFGKFDSTHLLDQLRLETSTINNELFVSDNETKKKIIDFFEEACSDCFISGVVPDTATLLIKFLKDSLNLNTIEIDNKYLRNIIDVDVLLF